MSEINILPDIGIFSELSTDVLRKLTGFGTYHRYLNETKIIDKGVFQDSFIFVVSGELQVYGGSKEWDKYLATIEPGETLGEVNLFTPSSASANVYVTEECEIWEMKSADLEGFIRETPEVGAILMRRIIELLGSRIRRVNEKVTGSNASLRAEFYATE